MKYLILGSEGQIGKSLCDFLVKHGNEVFRYDIQNDDSQDLRTINKNKNNKKNFLSKLEQSDFVYFLAWDVGGSKYLEAKEGSFDFLNNNVLIMNNVFESLYKIQKPFVFTSSQMAYMSDSVYGNTKLLGEKYTKAANGICVKLWNVYGEHDSDGEKSHVITDFVKQGIQKKQIDMLTDGNESRQLLHVDDCCAALYRLSLLNKSDINNKELHITSFQWIKIKDVAMEVAKQLGCNFCAAKKKDRVQNDKRIEPDKFILDFWEPQISIEDGIKRIIKKHLDM